MAFWSEKIFKKAQLLEATGTWVCSSNLGNNSNKEMMQEAFMKYRLVVQAYSNSEQGLFCRERVVQLENEYHLLKKHPNLFFCSNPVTEI